jgi:hypothetical protein
MAVEVGDTLIDNDPRCPGRTLNVLSVGDAKAVCENVPGRRVMISLARIYEDEKLRRSGFTLRKA